MKNKRFGICYNPDMDKSAEVCELLADELMRFGVWVEAININELKSGFNFIFVIGGDGTILKAARFYSKTEIPIFGINLGRLGFLSQSSVDLISKTVSEIMAGNFVVESRVMLSYGTSLALNDVVVKGSLTGRTSRFSLKINGEVVCDYLADGVIVATPTGSTAYGLSAGGPVLTPSLNAFVIVPICAHTLNARPLVVPDSEIITVCSAEIDKKYVVSVDGQEFCETASDIEIKKSEFSAKLALLNNSGFYTILRDKLHWGQSPIFCK